MDDRHPGRKDASGDIRVGLDSSIPCWNDTIGGACASDERNYFTDIPKERDPGALLVLKIQLKLKTQLEQFEKV
jgi:hypothetical protein